MHPVIPSRKGYYAQTQLIHFNVEIKGLTAISAYAILVLRSVTQHVLSRTNISF